jgi:adenine deaminase
MAGVLTSELNLEKTLEKKLKDSQAPLENTIKRLPMKESDFSFQFKKGKYNVIEIIRDEIITKHLVVDYDGHKFLDDDILYMVNVERYGGELKPALGLVKGTQMKKGAIAASVAHDSHNLMAIGTNVSDIVVAINSLIKTGGGLCVASEKQILAQLDLPLAGLLSLKSGEEIFKEIKELKKAYQSCGITLDEPFIQMAFLTDKGLFDVTQFKYIALEAQ